MMRFAAVWSAVRLTDSTTASLPLWKPKAEKAPLSGSPRGAITRLLAAARGQTATPHRGRE
jgi:hypothetical protein